MRLRLGPFIPGKKVRTLEANMRLCDLLDVPEHLGVLTRCPLQTGRCGYRR